jgi:ankyrin repeat protein
VIPKKFVYKYKYAYKHRMDIQTAIENDDVDYTLTCAVANGSEECVKLCFQYDKKNIANVFVLSHKNYDIMKFLIDNGIDVNSRDRKGNTALMFSSFHGAKRCVKLLLDHGADPNIVGAEGTAISGAAYGRRLDIVKILLEHGADPNVKHDLCLGMVTALDMALTEEIRNLLISNGAVTCTTNPWIKLNSALRS